MEVNKIIIKIKPITLRLTVTQKYNKNNENQTFLQSSSIEKYQTNTLIDLQTFTNSQLNAQSLFCVHHQNQKR